MYDEFIMDTSLRQREMQRLHISSTPEHQVSLCEDRRPQLDSASLWSNQKRIWRMPYLAAITQQLAYVHRAAVGFMLKSIYVVESGRHRMWSTLRIRSARLWHIFILGLESRKGLLSTHSPFRNTLLQNDKLHYIHTCTNHELLLFHCEQQNSVQEQTVSKTYKPQSRAITPETQLKSDWTICKVCKKVLFNLYSFIYNLLNN